MAFADSLNLDASKKRASTHDRVLWPALAGLLVIAGVAHFAAPDSFAAIVPGVLPGSGRFWVFVSGATEIGLAIAIVITASRRMAATLVAVFFVLVFPANIAMAVDWAKRPTWEFLIALLRLPFQLPLIWFALAVRVRANERRVGGVRHRACVELEPPDLLIRETDAKRG